MTEQQWDLETPEGRLEKAKHEALQAGLVVIGAVPLAYPEDPHVVARYELQTLDPSGGHRAGGAVDDVVPVEDLVPWTPAPEPEPVFEEPVYYDEEGNVI